ncbi:hypothetical protein D3C75_975510 [compost metagenome]
MDAEQLRLLVQVHFSGPISAWREDHLLARHRVPVDASVERSAADGRHVDVWRREFVGLGVAVFGAVAGAILYRRRPR